MLHAVFGPASHYLHVFPQAASWILEAAIDTFYSSPDPGPQVSLGRRRTVEALFERLKDPAQDAIMADGITQFCSDLEVFH